MVWSNKHRSFQSKGLLLVTVFVLLFCRLQAQEPDSTQIDRIQDLQAKLDSLQKEITKLKMENENANYIQPDTAIFDTLLTATMDTSLRIDDQRSRRRRLDALLEEYMKRPGVINFNGNATAILQWSFAEQENIATITGSFDLFVATKLGAQTLLFIDLEAIGGNGPNENFVTFSALNGDAGTTQTEDGFDRMHVLEAWVEFNALGEAAKFNAGKIDLTNYFDNNAVANDETAQFISGAFINSTALPVPGNTPGIKLRAELKRRLFFQIAVVSDDNSGNRIFEQLFKIAGTGFRIAVDNELIGTYRMYGYLHGGAGNAKGYGFSVDQPLGRGVTLFGRWNRNDAELATFFGIKSAWSGGGQWITRAWRGTFIAGAAFGITKPASESLNDESIAEIYLRQQINHWTHISPHLQVVSGAAGSSEQYLILGLRAQFDF